MQGERVSFPTHAIELVETEPGWWEGEVSAASNMGRAFLFRVEIDYDPINQWTLREYLVCPAGNLLAEDRWEDQPSFAHLRRLLHEPAQWVHSGREWISIDAG